MLDINFYMLVLPLFTVVPINVAFEWLIKEHPDATKLKGRSKTIYKIKIKAGIIIGILATLGAYYSIWVLAAHKNRDESLNWTLDFIFMIC